MSDEVEIRQEDWFVGGNDPVEHFAAMGRFIEGFSSVELALHLVMRRLLNVPEDVSRALLDDQQIPHLLMRIPVIANAVGTSERFRARFHVMRLTIEYLWAVRARVAHQPFMRTATHFRFTDLFVTSRAKAQTYICSIAQLNSGGTFLHALSGALSSLVIPSGPPFDWSDFGENPIFRERQDLPPKVKMENPNDHIQRAMLRYFESPEPPGPPKPPPVQFFG